MQPHAPPPPAPLPPAPPPAATATATAPRKLPPPAGSLLASSAFSELREAAEAVAAKTRAAEEAKAAGPGADGGDVAAASSADLPLSAYGGDSGRWCEHKNGALPTDDGPTGGGEAQNGMAHPPPSGATGAGVPATDPPLRGAASEASAAEIEAEIEVDIIEDDETEAKSAIQELLHDVRRALLTEVAEQLLSEARAVATDDAADDDADAAPAAAASDPAQPPTAAGAAAPASPVEALGLLAAYHSDGSEDASGEATGEADGEAGEAARAMRSDEAVASRLPPDFRLPAWAASAACGAPTRAEAEVWVVEKRGSRETRRVRLPLTASVLGRERDRCDVWAEHISVSRQHAALIFDAAGALYLVDLGSAQGTTVQRRGDDAAKPVEPSTAVRLRPGDVFNLGLCGSRFVIEWEGGDSPGDASPPTRSVDSSAEVEADSSAGSAGPTAETAAQSDEETGGGVARRASVSPSPSPSPPTAAADPAAPADVSTPPTLDLPATSAASPPRPPASTEEVAAARESIQAIRQLVNADSLAAAAAAGAAALAAGRADRHDADAPADEGGADAEERPTGGDEPNDATAGGSHRHRHKHRKHHHHHHHRRHHDRDRREHGRRHESERGRRHRREHSRDRSRSRSDSSDSRHRRSRHKSTH